MKIVREVVLTIFGTAVSVMVGGVMGYLLSLIC